MIKRQSVFLAVLFFGIASSSHGQVVIQFEDVTEKSGIKNFLKGMMGHGAAWGDFEDNGVPDLFVGGFCDRPDAEYAPVNKPVHSYLLRQTEDGTFAHVAIPGTMVYGRTSGAVFADLNNDGEQELFISNNAKASAGKTMGIQGKAKVEPSRLLQDRDNYYFDITEKSGAVPKEMQTARNIGIFDYNRDGLLDLLIIEDRFRKNPKSRLMKNLGKLKFEDVTETVGLPNDLFGLGHAVADWNNDGFPDFLVGHSNRFFLSDGKGKYQESKKLAETFAWKPLHNEDWPCGVATADINNDGLLDIVLGIHGEPARNRVYLNTGIVAGEPTFRDITKEAGLPDSLAVKTPHVELIDFDNDGRPDIYTTAAYLQDDGSIHPVIYRNVTTDPSKPRFEEQGATKGKLVYFPAGPSADFNRDGKRDLFLVNWYQNNHCRLLKNSTAEVGNWVTLKATGKKFNSDGIGTRFELFEAGTKKRLGTQEINVGYGYASGQMAECHFGLGKHDQIDLQVRFPDGTTHLIEKLPVNKLHIIQPTDK
ncbi:MAG: CRTAC1 family protein [Zavarzinella sp.]